MKTDTRKECESELIVLFQFLCKNITILGVVATIAACGLITVPVAVIQTGVDAALINETGRSSSEHIASGVTQKDCHWPRIIDNVPVCMTLQEEQSYILSKHCKKYFINWLGLPRCAEDEN